MAIQRTRKDKENPNYNFLYSWTPSHRDSGPGGQPKGSGQARVKRESKISYTGTQSKLSASKKAEEWAKDGSSPRIKKDIIRSLILVSFILALEFVIYLSRIEISAIR